MGAKTWMLVYAEGSAREALKNRPVLDADATLELATELFAPAQLERLGDGNLAFTCPRGRDICVGCFPGVSVVAAKEFGGDYPSRLPQRFLAAAAGRTVWLHAMHSVVDWFAYAKWVNGKLVRSLSVSPDTGVREDFGARMSFEEPYWAGLHPVHSDPDDDEDYPLPFHPLDMAEAALAELFGYQLEGDASADLVDPESIPLVRYRRSRPWWQLWR